jgi:hypothetical protein
MERGQEKGKNELKMDGREGQKVGVLRMAVMKG